MEPNSHLDALQARLCYCFSRPELLLEALTHRSFLNEPRGEDARDNERLEFFGDAVLGFLVSRLLLERYPDSREGELTRLRASLVHEERLARLAEESGIGPCLRLGHGEEKGGGRSRRSLLADAFEAVVAAVFLDGGVEEARRVVESRISPLLPGLLEGLREADSKSRLQELVQARFGEGPVYRIAAVTGPPHQRHFVAQVLAGGSVAGEGSGRSKKEAEQAAARAALASDLLADP
jgi:ribonuclease-3